MRPKVFGIGFHKTGTSSLAAALRLLGYRVTGPNGVHLKRLPDRIQQHAFELVPRFDAFQDNPWPILFRELDERFPGSRFVLTVREPARWFESVERHFGTASTPMREWIYGVGAPAGQASLYRQRYERHNEAVAAHFANRPNDLLVLRITDGEGWETLCPFLGMDAPDAEFPHANPARDRSRRRWRRWRWWPRSGQA
ncbi:MAG: hypothetical protein HKO59_12010 [Phycisphaerales bacterium]|nr:hypothetical protein [Phycisphaerales bacterium]NNM26686.1 hypothetical protein [Phycisphaerales bacterium]